MDEASQKICDSVSVDIEDGVQFGFPRPKAVMIEAPANIRRGIYDVDVIGAFTYMGGRETFLRHVSVIGRFCSIASNVVAGQMEHPTDFLSAHPLFEGAFDWRQLKEFRSGNQATIRQAYAIQNERLGERNAKIVIGNDVWIGEGVFIRRGIEIGDGAIIAARSVVTKDVPPYAIVGGTPAKLLRMRFEPSVIEELQRLEWWQYGLSALDGIDVTDIGSAIATIDRNIALGLAEPYPSQFLKVDEENTASLWHYSAEEGAFYPE